MKSSASPDGDAQLPLDEVESGDQLGDGVLDLQSGVHLEEEELAVLVEELDRAGVDVAAGLARPCTAASPMARRTSSGKFGGRRLLDELLVATLGRAVALAEPQGVAVGVREDLHLDVARPGEVALDVTLRSSEVALRLALGALERGLRLRRGSLTTFMPRPPPP